MSTCDLCQKCKHPNLATRVETVSYTHLTNFCRQDEKLNKFRNEFHERLEQKVTLINQQSSEVTAELKTQSLLNKEEIQNTREECTQLGENIKAVSYTHLDVYKRQVIY